MKKEILIKVIKFLLYAVLFIPLIFSRSLMYPFNTLKVFVFFSLMEIIFALWLGLIIFHKEYRPRFTPLKIILGLFFILLIISSIFGLDWHRSLWSVQARALGLIALFHFGALFIVLSGLWREINWKKYLGFSFIVSSIIALTTIGVGLKLIDGNLFITSNIRPGVFFGNSSFTASYIFFHIFIGLWLFFEFLRKGANKIMPILIGILTMLNVWAIFLTETRAALLGVMIGIIFLLIYFSVSRRQNFADIPVFSKLSIRKLSAFFLVIIIVCIGVFWFTRTAHFWEKIPSLRRATEFFALSRPAETEPRFIALKIGWQSFLERPILGFGFENFKYPFDRHYDPRLLRFDFSGTYWDKPHNVFLEYLINTGILGFMAYLGIFIVAFKKLIGADKKLIYADKNISINQPESALISASPFLMAMLIAYLAQNFFLFDTFGSYLMFFILLAFIDGNYKHKDDANENKIEKKQNLPNSYIKAIVIVLLVLVSFIPIYFVNYKSLYANNRQYWGLNYFLNRMSASALVAYAQSLSTPNPYTNDIRKDFASAVSDIYSQGIFIPEIEKVSAKAMSELALAINSQPNDGALRLTFANLSSVFYVFNSAYLKAGEEQGAQSLKLSPQRQEIYYTLAKIKVIEGEKSAAVELMKKAVELDPEAADPHFYYGFTLLEAGERELGFAEIERAKKLGRGPQNNGEARVLGNYYGDAGDYEKAIYMYLTAISYNQDDLDSQLKLGMVYFYSGDRGNARFRLKQILDALPEFKKSPSFETVKPIIEDLGL
ncbi:MAG: O-antigen ligase family protein [bacterium]|nr:O-antigen ligase family protein [bacterium]